MQLLTKKEIEKLLKKTSHELTVDDLDEIQAIDKLADKVAGVSSRERRLLSSPFELSGRKFYPMTIAKSLWLEEKVMEWGVSESEQQGMSFWLFTIPLDSESLEQYSSYKEAAKAARKLNKSLHCTEEELAEVCRKCLGVYESEPKTSGDEDGPTESRYGGLVTCMMKEYGGTPAQWLYDTPLTVIAQMFDEFEARIISEEKQTKRTPTKVATVPRITESMRASHKFNLAIRELSRKWSESDGA